MESYAPQIKAENRRFLPFCLLSPLLPSCPTNHKPAQRIIWKTQNRLLVEPWYSKHSFFFSNTFQNTTKSHQEVRESERCEKQVNHQVNYGGERASWVRTEMTKLTMGLQMGTREEKSWFLAPHPRKVLELETDSSESLQSKVDNKSVEWVIRIPDSFPNSHSPISTLFLPRREARANQRWWIPDCERGEFIDWLGKNMAHNPNPVNWVLG